MTATAETNEEMVERLQAVGEGTAEATSIIGALWEKNNGLVRLTVHRLTGLSNYDSEFEDMLQQAFFGFYTAAYSYDPTIGVKFSTYASKRIKWELTRYYERNGFTVHIPAYMRKRLRDCAEKRRQLEAETNCPVTYAVVLEKMGFSPVVIAETLAAFSKLETTSLDSVGDNETDNNSISLLNMLTAEDDVEETVLSHEWLRELHNILMTALQEVPDNVCSVIIRHYFQGVPLAQIAEEQGITRQTLYNQEAAAFRYIRTGKYGTALAEFMPSHNSYKRAQRLIKQDREAIERLQLTETERGLLIL